MKGIVALLGFALIIIALILIGSGYVHSFSSAYKLMGILMAAGTLIGILNKMSVDSMSLARYTLYGVAAVIGVWAVYNAVAHAIGLQPMTLDGFLDKITGGLWGKLTSKLSLGG